MLEKRQRERYARTSPTPTSLDSFTCFFFFLCSYVLGYLITVWLRPDVSLSASGEGGRRVKTRLYARACRTICPMSAVLARGVISLLEITVILCGIKNKKRKGTRVLSTETVQPSVSLCLVSVLPFRGITSNKVEQIIHLQQSGQMCVGVVCIYLYG